MLESGIAAQALRGSFVQRVESPCAALFAIKQSWEAVQFIDEDTWHSCLLLWPVPPLALNLQAPPLLSSFPPFLTPSPPRSLYLDRVAQELQGDYEVMEAAVSQHGEAGLGGSGSPTG